eukprot:CAMPEP_0171453912 /NCGR_PEP_ID=MMETSP0945-20130129/1419_1 /TAXON_ID=109269 /ORGANISM="Vaucheria litorea, Strain CCMP2940" /LENGTH=320 /DNA_ID=CAMNT_0011978851 /DNA_START=55 /DNA_END=1014 /DNA_ORIENTATION=-
MIVEKVICISINVLFMSMLCTCFNANLKMNSGLSDRELSDSLKRRVSELGIRKSMYYDSKSSKAIYYEKFNKSKQIQEDRYSKNDESDKLLLENLSLRLNQLKESKTSPEISPFNGQDALVQKVNESGEIKQLFNQKETTDKYEEIQNLINPSLYAEKWVEFRLQKKEKRACSVQSKITHILENLGGKEFLRKAEIKHSRAAMIAICCQFMASLSLRPDFQSHLNLTPHSAIISFVGIVLLIGAAFETEIVNFNGESLEKKCSTISIGYMYKLAEDIRKGLNLPVWPKDDRYIMDGNTLTRIATQAEVGHGRMAILAIIF